VTYPSRFLIGMSLQTQPYTIHIQVFQVTSFSFVNNPSDFYLRAVNWHETTEILRENPELVSLCPPDKPHILPEIEPGSRSKRLATDHLNLAMADSDIEIRLRPVGYLMALRQQQELHNSNYDIHVDGLRKTMTTSRR